MTLNELLDEYNLSDDDVRWSLSRMTAERLRYLLDHEGAEALTDFIWSGGLGDELYDMEERWARNRRDRLERGILDEGHLRDELAGFVLDRVNRPRR